MFILKKGHQPGVYVPLRALFLVGIMAVDKKISNLNIEDHVKAQVLREFEVG